MRQVVLIRGSFDVFTAGLVEVMQFFGSRYRVILIVENNTHTINSMEDRLMVAKAFGFETFIEHEFTTDQYETNVVFHIEEFCSKRKHANI
jgi:hypothetical protein